MRFAITLSVCLFFAGVTAAGPLAPPVGPVAPTHKTLTEVEPRIPINATNTPGSPGVLYGISQPGSYYLTGNISAAGITAIQALVPGVTIDLNGFAVTGNGALHYGLITVARTKVRNGTLSGWGLSAVRCGDDSIIEDLTIVGVTGSNSAVETGARSIVRSVNVQSGPIAIMVGNTSLVADCAASSVTFGVYGFTDDVTVERCRFNAANNTGQGVSLGNRCVIRNCQLTGFGSGIFVFDSCVIERCIIAAGGSYGLRAGAQARCTDVTVSGATDIGIYLAGDAGFLSGCHLRSCFEGIQVQNDTVIERCVAIGGTATGIGGISRNTITQCLVSKHTGTGAIGFLFVDSNTFTECRSDENGNDGFNARFGNIWDRCSARANANDGIEGAAGSVIRGCRLDTNGAGATVGANIRITGDAGRIEGNTLISGDFGIQTTTGGNIIIRNSSRNCPNDYGGIASGNFVGTIVTTEALMNGAANDLVNIEH